MRKFLIGIFIVSLIALIYIWQHTRLLEYSYLANSYNKSLALLVDQNNHLRYNIVKLESPARLETIMMAKRDNDISMPRVWYKINIKQESQSPEIAIASVTSFNNLGKVIRGIFSLDNEAVAKELK